MTDHPEHTDHSCCDHHDHHHDIVVKDLTVKYRTLTALKNISFNLMRKPRGTHRT